LRVIFDESDKDKNGVLDQSELLNLVSKAFKSTSNIDLESTLNRKYSELQANLHSNNEGKVDFQQFTVLYKHLLEDPQLPISLKRSAQQADTDYLSLEGENAPKRITPQEEVNQEEKNRALALFNKYDTDSNGTIDPNELKNLLKEHMGPRVSNMLLNRFVETNINLGDKNNDGLIIIRDVVQFCTFFFPIVKPLNFTSQVQVQLHTLNTTLINLL